MSQDFLATLHKITPLCDKILVVLGGASIASFSIGHIQAWVTILVGLATFAMMVPRAIIAWRAAMRDIRGEKLTREEEEE